ncbi:uncharacterized protein isoform X2 [Musca autumnalis]
MQEIKEIDDTFPFSSTESRNCFRKLLFYYKQLKTQKNSSDWEFFETFDGILGDEFIDLDNDDALITPDTCPTMGTMGKIKQEPPENDEFVMIDDTVDLDDKYKKWTRERRMLVIQTRIKCQPNLHAKKVGNLQTWEHILLEIKKTDHNFPFSKEEISKFFNNILVTYRRIKSRQNSGRRFKTRWEYFDMIDNAFGNRHNDSVMDATCIQQPSVEYSIDESASSSDESTSNVLDIIKTEPEEYVQHKPLEKYTTRNKREETAAFAENLEAQTKKTRNRDENEFKDLDNDSCETSMDESNDSIDALLEHLRNADSDKCPPERKIKQEWAENDEILREDTSYMDDKKWSYERKKLVIETRLKYQPEIEAKLISSHKTWDYILLDIKQIDSGFPFSKRQIARFFYNILVTYKRIKNRKNTLGQVKTNWEFFDMMDHVFGDRHDNDLDANSILQESLEYPCDESAGSDDESESYGLDIKKAEPKESVQHLVLQKSKLEKETNESFVENPAVQSEKKWNHERKMLVLKVRLKYQPQFVAKKLAGGTLWKQIMQDIKQIDKSFPFGIYEVERCFCNMMMSYKRIKKRQQQTGNVTTAWLYFGMMDKVFGRKSSNVSEQSNENSSEDESEAGKESNGSLYIEREAQANEEENDVESNFSDHIKREPNTNVENDTAKTDKKWTPEQKMLLLKVRLRHQTNWVDGKKTKEVSCWQQIMNEIKEIDESFPFDKYEIERCFINLMITYRRIKKSGREAITSWEYFDVIDEIFGHEDYITQPKSGGGEDDEDDGDHDDQSSTHEEQTKGEFEAYYFNEEEKEKRWTHQRKKLFLDARLRHQPDFLKNKRTGKIWDKILQEIKEVDEDFPFNKADCKQLYFKMISTYRRIKTRYGTNAGATTKWEFFNAIDKVYGGRYKTLPANDNTNDGSLMSDNDTTQISEFGNNPAEEENSNKWTHERRQLVLQARLKHHTISRSKLKKHMMWMNIMAEIKSSDPKFPFCMEEVKKCFNNLLTTYRRTKQRHKESGEVKSSWEFFDEMDEVLGSGSNTPCHRFENGEETIGEDILNYDTLMCETIMDVEDEDDDFSSHFENTTNKTSKRKQNTFLGFLKEEENQFPESNSKRMKEDNELGNLAGDEEPEQSNEEEENSVDEAEEKLESKPFETLLKIETERLAVEKAKLVELQKISNFLEKLVEKT